MIDCFFEGRTFRKKCVVGIEYSYSGTIATTGLVIISLINHHGGGCASGRYYYIDPGGAGVPKVYDGRLSWQFFHFIAGFDSVDFGRRMVRRFNRG